MGNRTCSGARFTSLLSSFFKGFFPVEAEALPFGTISFNDPEGSTHKMWQKRTNQSSQPRKATSATSPELKHIGNKSAMPLGSYAHRHNGIHASYALVEHSVSRQHGINHRPLRLPELRGKATGRLGRTPHAPVQRTAHNPMNYEEPWQWPTEHWTSRCTAHNKQHQTATQPVDL